MPRAQPDSEAAQLAPTGARNYGSPRNYDFDLDFLGFPIPVLGFPRTSISTRILIRSRFDLALDLDLGLVLAGSGLVLVGSGLDFGPS